MTTDNNQTPPATAPAATPTTQTPATPTPSPSSPASQNSPAPAPADDDLITGKPKEEGKPADKPAEKAPETAAEKRGYLEGKLDEEGKKSLEGKTDEEIEKLYNEQKDKEALGDFKLEDIKTPEDMPIPEEMKEKVGDLAKIFNDAKLKPAEKMQKAVDLHIEIQNKQLKDFVNLKAGWKKTVEDSADLKAMVGPANDVVRKFAGDGAQLEEFQGCLKMLGLGNHPSFVRFCGNIAKAIGEDTFDGQGNKGGGQKKDLAELMYPDMKSTNATS